MNIEPIKKMRGSEFLTLLAHEVRTPLAVILTTLELIREEGIDPKKTQKHLETVRGRVRALSKLVDDLLGDSHIPHDASTFTLKEKTTAPLSRKNVRGSVLGLKVLVVDDDQGAADVLGQLLTLRGCDVTVAYSGVEALEKALVFLPAVAILDIGMPGMDGFELVRRLRERKNPCVYIALTGYGRINDKKKALKAGFDHHFTKPAQFKQIEKVLRKDRSLDELMVKVINS